MALQELRAADYGRLVARVRSLDMNALFARAVVEQRAPGRVLVDSIESPAVAHVKHGYGMSLLLGSTGRAERDAEILDEVLARRGDGDEWLQIADGSWAELLSRAPGVESYTRVNFRFSGRTARPSSSVPIVRADRSAFEMAGSVVPRAFWGDADRFVAEGAGFAAIVDGELASLAFSAFVIDSQLEIGIETAPRHRGRGLATHACAALIDHCLERGVEPVWACRLENTASHRLAEALGFEPVRHLAYFCLRGSRGAAA